MTKVLAMAMAAVLFAAGAPAQDRQPGLTVEGVGAVDAAPDMATLMIGVDAEAEAPSDAAATMAEEMGAVIAALEGAGVAEQDLQTGELSLRPVYDDPQEPGSEPAVAGYVATNLVTVTIRDLPRVGDVLDAGIGGGATRLEGLVFGLADPAPVVDAALAEAMADAMRKAQVLAEAGELELGAVREVHEISGRGPAPMQMRAMEADITVAPGTVETRAQVAVTFALAP